MIEKALKKEMPLERYHLHDGISGPDSVYSAMAFMFRRSGPCVLLASLLLCFFIKILFYTVSFVDVLLVGVFVLFRGFMEWGIHVWIHHARPLPFLGVRIKTPVYEMHIRHHREPWNIDTFLFGGVAMATGMVLMFLFGYVVFGGINHALTATFLFALCLLIYEVVHVLCHSSIRPKTKFLENILKTHRQHHFLDSRRWFGVSSPMADRFIGTDRRRVS